MATTYFRLQIYFILSVVIAYIAFLGVWFNVDDRIVKSVGEGFPRSYSDEESGSR